MKDFATALVIAVLLVPRVFAGSADTISLFQGQWVSEDGKMVYQAGGCPQGLCVTVIGVNPHLDSKGQPDASCGLQILTLSKWVEGRKRWEGEVLDPGSRKKYSASLELGKDGKPVMRAGWGLIKFSERWRKFTGSVGQKCEMK